MLLNDDPVHAFMPYPAVAVPNAPNGPLAGLTVAVKDLFDVVGYPTGWGQPHALALSGIKSRTAPLVQDFLNAGARFVGKTHTVELAYSLNGKNIHFGTPINPAAPNRIPGGSSSGSAAAVAAGLCDVAIGSDTGGSVRAPASYCGLFGIRPTHGRLSLDLAMPLAPSFDTGGWFTRDAATFTRVGDALLGEDTSPLPASPRLLIAEDLFEQADPAAKPLFAAMLARLDRMMQPLPKVRVVAPDFDALYWAFRYLQGHEAWASHADFIIKYRPSLGPGIAERFAFASRIGHPDVKNSQNVRKRFREHLASILERDGVLILPTVPDIPETLDASEAALETQRAQSLRLLCVSGLSGFPQISIPLLSRDGAPIGLSILGPHGSDRSLVHLAARIAEAGATQIA
jgi:amidase